MTPANPLATPSLALSGFVLAAAAFLAVRQWFDRDNRFDEGASEEDLHHYASQDVRRWRGIILMALIGLVASTGYWVNPTAGRDQARFVFAAWVVIGTLLFILVALAGIDWIYLASFARRHRQRLAEERQALVEAYNRRVNRRPPPGNDGHPA
ncbi:MAG: hypothetical protein U0800_18240 [Isosphaeraceae bacterium]